MNRLTVHKTKIYPDERQIKCLQTAFFASRHAFNFAKEILDGENRINAIAYREALASGQIKNGQKFNGNGFTSLVTNSKETGQRSIKALYNTVKPDWYIINDDNVQERVSVGTATPEAIEDVKRSLVRYFDIQKGKVALPATIKNCRNCQHKNKVATLGRFYKCVKCGSFMTLRKDGFRRGWLNWRSQRSHSSFTHIKPVVDGRKIRYNAKVGFIKMSEYLRYSGTTRRATFSFDGINYWVAITVLLDDNHLPELPAKKGDFIGVDLGIKDLATTSQHDEPFENPKAYRKYEKKLSRLQRKLDRQNRVNNPDNFDDKGRIIAKKRKWKKSNRMLKTELAIKKLHIKIANIRNNAQHQLTSELAKRWEYVGYEDLNVRGMLKNPKLAKHIADVGFGEIRRQLEYKSEWYDCEPILVDRFFPSSKLCSNCGEVNKELTLKDRVWVCDSCNQFNDRDLNAALNLEKEARRIVNDSP